MRRFSESAFPAPAAGSETHWYAEAGITSAARIDTFCMEKTSIFTAERIPACGFNVISNDRDSRYESVILHRNRVIK